MELITKIKKIQSRDIVGNKISSFISKLGLYLFLIGISYIFLFPFLYMAVTSFKDSVDLFDFAVTWIPRKLEWRNYAIAFNLIEYPKFLINSVIYTLVGTVAQMFACAYVAYGFARYNFIGKKFWFFILLLSIIIPTQTIVVPSYIIFSNLGWLNSYLPMLVLCFFGLGLKGGLFIYLYRQFYIGLPKELENAAKIDGCSYFGTFWRIVFPMSRSSILVVGILSMVWHWNDYYEPSVYATSEELSLLPRKTYQIIEYISDPPLEMLSSFIGTDQGNPINTAVLMAGMMLCLVPILLVYLGLQRGFIEGIERTGLVE